MDKGKMHPDSLPYPSTPAIEDVSKQHRVEVHPVEDRQARPTWSVMIPTYNSVAYLRETLDSVLSQDPGPERMQIEVVDDHSSRDDPEALVREMGKGRVLFYRQPQNVGHVRNFETCLQRSRGRLIHLLHGDDRIRPGFYETMERPFREHPEIGAAFCRYIGMDEQGHWTEFARPELPQAGLLKDAWLERIATGQRLQTPSMVVRRSVYEQIGGFDRRIRWMGEDWEMWVRIAANYPIWYDPALLAEYRRHGNSLTGQSVRSGEDIQDLRLVVQINKTHLKDHPRVERITREAGRWCAGLALHTARRAASAGDWEIVRVQVRESLRSSRSLKIVAKAGALLTRAMLRKRPSEHKRSRDVDSGGVTA
jgi:glycosyltransferase involved in cell wall biosynthesis